MSEQQTTSACPHPEAVGKRWGDPISAERQAGYRATSTDGRLRRIMVYVRDRSIWARGGLPRGKEYSSQGQMCTGSSCVVTLRGWKPLRYPWKGLRSATHIWKGLDWNLHD